VRVKNLDILKEVESPSSVISKSNKSEKKVKKPIKSTVFKKTFYDFQQQTTGKVIIPKVV